LSLVVVPLVFLGRRWGRSILAITAFVAFVVAGVAAAWHPAASGSEGAGALSGTAQIGSVIALAAVLCALTLDGRGRRGQKGTAVAEELASDTPTDPWSEPSHETTSRPLNVLICLAAAKVSEPRLTCYLEMPDARILVIGDDSRAAAENLLRFSSWRIPHLGTPERWTSALSWFRGFNKFDPGPTDFVLSMELLNPTSLQASHLAKRLNVPHIITIAEILPNNPVYRLPPWREIWHAMSKSADAFVCSVELARDFAIGKGCPPGKCVVINPGIDLERFTPREGGRTEEPVVLFVGELRADKGLRHVISAARAARDRIPELRLIIAGDGPLRAEVEAQAQQERFIEYQGRILRDQLPELYRNARSFVLAPYSRPSWAEQFGFASVEAMASGLPVVITDCGAVREVVPDWNPIVAQHDEAALAAGMIASLGNAGDEWGQRNRASAEERFEIRTQATRLRDWVAQQVTPER
jgi:glycosyltransferase involved in cell wall biosynthesis